MIKCFFVDVKVISSDLPRSNFVESELDKLADLILESNGLLRPIILQESKAGKYKVIEGHREYYAAVIAKGKNLKKGEMVNAFVLDADIKKSAIAQLALLSGEPVANNTNLSDDYRSLAQLLPVVESTISQQLQPICDRLTNCTETLDAIVSEDRLSQLISSAISHQLNPILDQLAKQTEIIDKLISEKITPPKTRKSTTIKETKIAKDSDPPLSVISSEDVPKQPKSKEAAPKKAPKATTAKKIVQEIDIPLAIPSDSDFIEQPPKVVTVPKTTNATKSKTSSDSLASIDLIKASSVLNLINTISQEQLTMKMERSGLKTLVKSAPTLIEYRNSQPEQKIDRWETLLAAKISGLGGVVIKKIIDKLK